MERIGGTQVLLLQDHLQDGDKVRSFLDWLEELRAVKTITRMNMALGFFSDEEEEPAAIIMFMNCQEAIGVYLSDNHYLLSSEKYGITRMKGSKRCQINGPGSVKSCLTEFIASLCHPKENKLYFLN